MRADANVLINALGDVEHLPTCGRRTQVQAGQQGVVHFIAFAGRCASIVLGVSFFLMPSITRWQCPRVRVWFGVGARG